MPLPSTSEWPTDDDSRVPPVTLHELMRQVEQHYAAKRPAMLVELRHVMALPLDDSSWPVDRTPQRHGARGPLRRADRDSPA